MKGNLSVGFIAVLGLCFAGLTGMAHAQDRNACARIEHDRQDLNKAVARYGPYNSHSQHERDELQRDSAACGDYNSGRYNDRDADDGYNNRYYGNGGSYNDPYYSRPSGGGYYEDNGGYGNGEYNGHYGSYGYQSPANENGYRD